MIVLLHVYVFVGTAFHLSESEGTCIHKVVTVQKIAAVQNRFKIIMPKSEFCKISSKSHGIAQTFAFQSVNL